MPCVLWGVDCLTLPGPASTDEVACAVRGAMCLGQMQSGPVPIYGSEARFVDETVARIDLYRLVPVDSDHQLAQDDHIVAHLPSCGLNCASLEELHRERDEAQVRLERASEALRLMGEQMSECSDSDSSSSPDEAVDRRVISASASVVPPLALPRLDLRKPPACSSAHWTSSTTATSSASYATVRVICMEDNLTSRLIQTARGESWQTAGSEITADARKKVPSDASRTASSRAVDDSDCAVATSPEPCLSSDEELPSSLRAASLRAASQVAAEGNRLDTTRLRFEGATGRDGLHGAGKSASTLRVNCRPPTEDCMIEAPAWCTAVRSRQHFAAPSVVIGHPRLAGDADEPYTLRPHHE